MWLGPVPQVCWCWCCAQRLDIDLRHCVKGWGRWLWILDFLWAPWFPSPYLTPQSSLWWEVILWPDRCIVHTKLYSNKVSASNRQDLFVILRDFSGLTQVLIPQEEVRMSQYNVCYQYSSLIKIFILMSNYFQCREEEVTEANIRTLQDWAELQLFLFTYSRWLTIVCVLCLTSCYFSFCVLSLPVIWKQCSVIWQSSLLSRWRELSDGDRQDRRTRFVCNTRSWLAIKSSSAHSYEDMDVRDRKDRQKGQTSKQNFKLNFTASLLAMKLHPHSPGGWVMWWYFVPLSFTHNSSVPHVFLFTAITVITLKTC